MKLVKLPKTVNPGSSYAFDVTVTPPDGVSIKATVTVNLEVDRAGVSAIFVASKDRTIDAGKSGFPKTVAATLSVPKSAKIGTKVSIKTWAYADGFTQGSDIGKLTVVKPKATKSPSPKSTHSSGSSGGSGSGSSGSSGSSGGSSGSSGSSDLGTLPSGTDNNLAPSTAPSQTPILPSATDQPQGQSPSVAPMIQNAGNSQSMRGTADAPDELSFNTLASTQAAWLAALLVAFSLLLTQVRLGKASVRSATRAATPKGAHRRTRKRFRRARTR